MKKKYFSCFEFSYIFLNFFVKKKYSASFLRISSKEKEFQCIFGGEV